VETPGSIKAPSPRFAGDYTPLGRLDRASGGVGKAGRATSSRQRFAARAAAEILRIF
jgi:hypothetical protein